MLAAHALRVIGPDRIVVRLDSTFSVIEMQLRDALAPDVLAKARTFVGPFKPVPVSVRPGEYRGGVFWGSEIGAMEFPAEARPRVNYKRRE